MRNPNAISRQTQRLVIRNFGPINHLKVNINDFMLFIGPQASGKSTIGKSIFFFKHIRDELLQFVIESADRNKFQQSESGFTKTIRNRFLDFWGPTFHLKEILLKYEYSQDVWIEITLEPENKFVDITYSSIFRDKFNTIIQHAKDYAAFKNLKNPALLTSAELIDMESQRKTFFSTVQNLVNDLFQDDRELLFIPAGRSLLATLSDQMQFLNSRKLDFLMREFVFKILNAKGYFNKSLSDLIHERRFLTQEEIRKDATKLAESLIKNILQGSYRSDRDGEKIYIDNKKFVKLNFSSSGQQESIWILLLLFIHILENRTSFIIIEEPEAHLYPVAQHDISKLIALAASLNNSQIIITTHSPYVLASINNLILAGNAGISQPEQVRKYIPKLLWLQFDKIFAAKVDAGEIETILDYDLRLIQSEEIDSASQKINQEFDYLYPLDGI